MNFIAMDKYICCFAMRGPWLRTEVTGRWRRGRRRRP